MADNITVRDSSGAIRTMRATDNAGVHTPHQIVSQTGTWTVQPGNTANTTPWLIRHNDSIGTATALGALNATTSHALAGNSGAAVTITATSTPSGITLTPYVSYDGGTNYSVTGFFDQTTENIQTTLTSFTVGAAYSIVVGDGVTHVRVQATAWTSGSVTVRLVSSNALGLINLKSGAQHDLAPGTFLQMVGAYAASTAPTAVGVGDAVRLWATTSGALNVADGGGSLTVDGTVTANAIAQTNVFNNESATAQAASATVTGTSRDVGVAAGTVHRYSAFNTSAFADQAGTLRIECSNDNTTWRRATADTAVAANAVVYLSVPIMTRYYRAVYVNGAAAQGAFMLNSSFTAS